MLGYIGRRLLLLIPLLILITFIVFCLTLLIPGDPARTLAGGEKATPEGIAQVQHQLHLDEPFFKQYLIWLGNVAHGDLGTSLFQNQSVGEAIAQKFPITFWIAFGGLVVTVLIGLPAGMIAGTRPGSLVDRVVTMGASVGVAMPDFWLATILISYFAISRGWTYSGYVPIDVDPVAWFQHLWLLWLTIGIAGAAGFARQLRGAVIDAMQQDYIRTAQAKGLTQKRIVLKHALKNASMAPITVLGLQFAYMLGGTAILERIFAKNGMGQYFLDGLVKRDLPVIQGVTLVVAVTFVIVNLVIDVIYAFLNPKVRFA